MIAYRNDIDSLRALAVMLVVLFHAGFGVVSGGFVGVDIFFVISGYLITAIITRDIDAGHFSLVDFYHRRLRRIFPAFIVVALFTLVVSWLLLMPADFRSFGKSLFGTAAYTSNIVFWREAGYFDLSKWSKPLLHTWSLAVEEQFYLFFPVAMMLVARFMKAQLALLIGAFFLLSLLGNIILVEGNRQAFAFYMLPTRAWELLLGSMLALRIYPDIQKRGVQNGLSLLGLAAMLYGGFSLTSSSSFPGFNALIPTLGAALFIYAGLVSGEAAWGSRLLSNKITVFTGKISYSLYLWHWPLIVFSKYALDRDLMQVEKIVIVAVSFAAGILSWKFIEQPFRHRVVLKKRRNFFVFCGLMSLFLIFMGLMIMDQDGLPQRFGKDFFKISEAGRNFNPLRDTCYHRGEFPSVDMLEQCALGIKEKTRGFDFILWGDSHADSFAPMVDQVMATQGFRGVEITGTACPPLMGAEIDVEGPVFMNQSKDKFKKCAAFNREVYDFIARNEGIRTVVLSARWGYYTKNVSINREEEDQNIYIFDAKDGHFSAENSQRVFRESLQRTVKSLHALGKRVVIIGPVPESTQNIPSCLAKEIILKRGSCTPLRLADFMSRQDFVLSAFSSLEDATVFYPHVTQCGGGTCMILKDGYPLYYDDDHLSIHGALFFADSFHDFMRKNHE